MAWQWGETLWESNLRANNIQRDYMNASAFDKQMERIKLITGKRTQTELADLLGIRQSSVSDAKRRGKIPSGWLVFSCVINSSTRNGC